LAMTPSGAVAAITTPAVMRLRAAAPGHGRPEASARRRILLCDDESQTLHALRVVLHRAGFEVDATRSAGEALDRSALWLAPLRTQQEPKFASYPPALHCSLDPYQHTGGSHDDK
jgi:hypothetical protein